MLCEVERTEPGSTFGNRIGSALARGRKTFSMKALRGFLGNSSGSTTTVFIMTLLPTVAVVGMMTDFGRSYAVKNQITIAMDAATLVGGRVFDNTGDPKAAVNAAQSYFVKVLPRNISASLTSIKADAKGNISMAARSLVPTIFLGAVGMSKLEVKGTVQSLAADSAGLDLDLALVMDVTGSMGDNQKLDTAKTAAKALVNILLPPNGTGSRKVRISIVPFSEFVNSGSYASAATGVANQTTSTYACYQWQQVCNTVCSHYNWSGSCTQTRYQCGYQQVATTCQQTVYLNSCMAERPASTGHAYDDASPIASPFHAFTTTNSNSTNCTAPGVSVTPLSADRTVLNSAIDALTPAGGTAGHIGTAWGWYTISPNWSSFWPAGSQPAATDPAKVMKAMIIMTDGAYNTHYDSNYATVYEGQSNNPNAGNGTSRNQANQICTNIKNAGIQVFSVGVELGSDNDSKNFLLGCVSSPNNLFSVHYYDVVQAIASQTGLVAAFNDIGTRLAVATGTGNQRTRLTK